MTIDGDTRNFSINNPFKDTAAHTGGMHDELNTANPGMNYEDYISLGFRVSDGNLGTQYYLREDDFIR